MYGEVEDRKEKKGRKEEKEQKGSIKCKEHNKVCEWICVEHLV